MPDVRQSIGSLAGIWPKTRDEDAKKKPSGFGRKPWMDDPETFVNRTECRQPGCDFAAEGPVGETSAAFKEHLAEAHPEVVARTATRRRRR